MGCYNKQNILAVLFYATQFFVVVLYKVFVTLFLNLWKKSQTVTIQMSAIVQYSIHERDKSTLVVLIQYKYRNTNTTQKYSRLHVIL